MTSAPASRSKLIKWLTLFVLPGIGELEKMTVSSGWTWIWRCVPFAIRLRAAIGSPWEPVHKIIVSFAGKRLISEASTKVPFGTLI